MPGLIEFARMPTRPPSSASSRVIAITAPFTAACAKFPGVAGSELMPEIDPVLMIEPPPRPTRCGQAALQA